MIIPQTTIWKVEEFVSHFKAKKVEEGFSYNSNQNENWESVQSIRKLIKQHVDPTFEALIK